MDNIYVVQLHSMVDVITNSSTELYIVDKQRVAEGFVEVFNLLTSGIEIDSETRIWSWEDYNLKEEIVLPKDTKMKDLYVIKADHHNELLLYIIKNMFHPISIKWAE